MKILSAMLLTATLMLAIAACTPSVSDEAETDAGGVGNPTSSNDRCAASVADPFGGKWENLIQDAAHEYKTYTRIGDYPAWAPTLCMAPRPDMPKRSEAADGDAHGRKLYYLWVRDNDAYVGDGRSEIPPAQSNGQVLVKESFKPVQLEDSSDGKPRFALGEASGLFVMIKLDESMPGTDRGWVYGVVSPSGSVTAAGIVENCASCHEGAGEGRLFGVRPSLFEDKDEIILTESPNK